MSNRERSSRREFLRSSSLTVAGASLAGGLALARSAHAAGSDAIKVALIGAGGRGTGAVSQLMSADSNLRLIAVADAFEARAKGALDKLNRQHEGQVDVPADRVFLGLKAYEQAVATDADLIVLATPPGFRPLQYQAAINAGKHVFMEKPCCVDAPGYRMLMESNQVADEKGLLVGVGLQRRHERHYIETIDKIQGGALGDIVFTRVYWNGGGIWNRAREPGMTEMQYQVHNWYHFCWLSGDNIGEQHIHNLDVGNWVMGDQHPVEANGMGGCTLRYVDEATRGTGQIFDHHFVEFTYADGTKMYSQCRHMRSCFNHVTEYAHGTKDMTQCGGGLFTESREEKKKRPRGHLQEQIDLVAALRAGKRYNEGYYGANSSMTAVLGRLANYSGKVVKWDEAVASNLSEFPQELSWDAPAPVQKDADGNYPIPVPGVFQPT